jgi:NAD(P) transhydrogenase subunit beta
MNANLAAFLYLVAGVLFILALRGLSSPATSRQGNMFGMIGMAIAILTTIAQLGDYGFWTWLLILLGMGVGGFIGAKTAREIPMTMMPELVAAFHSLVGLAAVFVAAGALYAPSAFAILNDPTNAAAGIKSASLLEMSLGVAIGAITFTGSVIAFAKLSGRMSGKPIILPSRHLINAALGVFIILLIYWFMQSGGSSFLFWLIVLASLAFGALIIIPIGGADMPVVVSMLNSYSGWAAAGIGFTLGNIALIITGALVGSSGAILSYIMCKGMNRQFLSVIAGGFGGETAGPAGGDGEQKPVKLGSAEDAAYVMKNASKVIIVPGYGMAVAQAQHALREMADALKKGGVEVKYAIHPVAGRMRKPTCPTTRCSSGKTSTRSSRRPTPCMSSAPTTSSTRARKRTNPRPSTACRFSRCGRRRRCSSTSARWRRAMLVSTTLCSTRTPPSWFSATPRR